MRSASLVRRLQLQRCVVDSCTTALIVKNLTLGIASSPVAEQFVKVDEQRQHTGMTEALLPQGTLRVR